jgi:prepilin-type N-terminal cleavage/methylation domain-containing protein
MGREGSRSTEEEAGFTLIELMVVVLILAILLAIAIPVYLGSRNVASARGTESNLRNALTAERTYAHPHLAIDKSQPWDKSDPGPAE